MASSDPNLHAYRCDIPNHNFSGHVDHCDCTVYSMKVVGYVSNKNVFPFIPNEIIIQDELTKKLIRNGPCQVYEGDYIPLEPFNLSEGYWFAVEEAGPVKFEFENELAWRSKRAQELVKQASTIQGDPLRVLEIGMAAAELQGLNLPELSRKVEEIRGQDEPLEVALSKIKDVLIG